jgi:neopullulanase
MLFSSSRRLALSVCLALAGCVSCVVGQQPSPIRIDKIDPPNWWIDLPSPMLLLHGEGLNEAQFEVHGKGVTITKTQVSANGHWAFVWLDTSATIQQTLTISAIGNNSHAGTKIEQNFVLAERAHDERAHAGFSPADVMYLIMTDRFAQGDASHAHPGNNRSLPRGRHGGDFAGIENHLDYLEELGVTAVWTTPVASNGAMREAYHGYAATDMYATDAHFGTLEEYRHLSDALHAKKMKLVIDLVPNHVGVEHPWVKDSPTPDWFHGTLEKHDAVATDFYKLVDPHATEAAAYDVTHGWFTDAMPDLNQENPLVAQYLIQNALWWVEKANLDGIRLDTFPYIGRTFWHDFHATLHRYYPHLTTVGEVFHRDPEVTSFFAGGEARRGVDTGLDTPFDFPIYFALRDVLAHGKPMTELMKVLGQDALYPHPERLVTFIGNHDTVRFTTAVSGSAAMEKLALGLTLTLRGMPQIYSGDEIGMTGGADPDNRHDFPGGFAGDARDAFTSAGRSGSEEDIFKWTAALAHLRTEHAELANGTEENLIADENVFAFARSPDTGGCPPAHDRERILVVVNKGPKSASVDLPQVKTTLAGCTDFQSLVPTSASLPSIAKDKLHLDEPAESMTIFAVR